MSDEPIVVAGDVVIDWIFTTLPSASRTAPPQNWEQYGRVAVAVRSGGALLIADLLEAGARVLSLNVPIVSYVRTLDFENIQLDRMTRSFIRIERSGDNRFRIKNFAGFSGATKSATLTFDGDTRNARLILINDAGNQFRDNPLEWPASLREGTAPILLKLNPPFRQGQLWNFLKSEHADRVHIVVTGDDLRSAGVHISRGISWDSTAADCVAGFKKNPLMQEFMLYSNVFIRFGLDGVLHYRKEQPDDFLIYYDPERVEGGFVETLPGYYMSGLGAAFCASLALDIQSPITNIETPIRQALVSSRRLFEIGFGENEADITVQAQELFDRQYSANMQFAVSTVPLHLQKVTATSWSFLRQIVGDDLPELAQRIVTHGEIPPTQYGVPLAKFGSLETLDRSEAESYRSIRNLFSEFLVASNPPRPLSIAVFGQPGAGKSFGDNGGCW